VGTGLITFTRVTAFGSRALGSVTHFFRSWRFSHNPKDDDSWAQGHDSCTDPLVSFAGTSEIANVRCDPLRKLRITYQRSLSYMISRPCLGTAQANKTPPELRKDGTVQELLSHRLHG
jgi:hypothetical protein